MPRFSNNSNQKDKPHSKNWEVTSWVKASPEYASCSHKVCPLVALILKKSEKSDFPDFYWVHKKKGVVHKNVFVDQPGLMQVLV